MQMKQGDTTRVGVGDPLRLLPWAGDGGKPCLLSSDGGDSFVSRIAERVESRQLEMAEDLLDDVGEILGRGNLPVVEWHNLVMALSVALHDVLRVACSRGDRLSRAGDDDRAVTVAAVTTGRVRMLHHEPKAVTWAREKAGLGKRALAQRVGISEQLMGDIEAGRRSATPANLAQIAKALNCPVLFLERKRARR